MKVSTHSFMHINAKLWEDKQAFKNKWSNSRAAELIASHDNEKYACVDHPAFIQYALLINDAWEFIFKAHNVEVSSNELLQKVIEVLKIINQENQWLV